MTSKAKLFLVQPQIDRCGKAAQRINGWGCKVTLEKTQPVFSG
jgi:hypothetical protein